MVVTSKQCNRGPRGRSVLRGQALCSGEHSREGKGRGVPTLTLLAGGAFASLTLAGVSAGAGAA